MCEHRRQRLLFFFNEFFFFESPQALPLAIRLSCPSHLGLISDGQQDFHGMPPLLFFKFILIEIQLIYNVQLVSGIQPSDSIFLLIRLHLKLLQNKGHISPCVTVDLCSLFGCLAL